MSLLACSNVGPARGSVMVVVDSNLTPGRDFDRLTVRVGDDSRDAVRYAYRWDEPSQRAEAIDGGRLPFSLSVQNATDSLAARTITLVAWRGEEAVFAREASVVLPVARTKMLRLSVDALCSGEREDGTPWASRPPEGGDPRSCAPGATCIAGTCASSHVEGDALPDYAPERVFGGTNGPEQGGRCVDVHACLGVDSPENDRAQRFDLRPLDGAASCALDVSQFPAGASFFVGVLARKQSGICNADRCVVHLDRVEDSSSAPGWTLRSGRIQLPPALCNGWRTVVVRSNGAGCLGMEVGTPICAEWSSLGGRSRARQANVASSRWGFAGGSDDGTVCRSMTASAALCERGDVRVGCGSVLVPDAACGEHARYANCGACNGATDGMVPIDGGAVMLGSSFAEVDAGVAYANEAPLRPVHLAPFWIDRVEVTAGAFRAWCESEAADIQVCSRVRENGAPCVDAATMPNHPMNCIAWPEANAYCRGVGKRLPSEEEWELAARGPERRTYPWGETPPSERDVCTSHLGRLFFGPCASGQGADDVTPEGVRDLGGSMSEWTSSGSSSGNLDARTAGARVSRGGAWVIDTAYRASFRRTLVPTARNLIQGFRCARDR